MVRYQSNQNIKKQLEQGKLSSTRNQSLRTDTALRTKSQARLNTNMKQENANTRTELRLKRKLLV